MSTIANSSSSIITYGNVQDAVADRIREMVLNGQLKPGDRLRQDELANSLGVSTMPIREALRKLQAEGLVLFMLVAVQRLPKSLSLITTKSIG